MGSSIAEPVHHVTCADKKYHHVEILVTVQDAVKHVIDLGGIDAGLTQTTDMYCSSSYFEEKTLIPEFSGHDLGPGVVLIQEVALGSRSAHNQYLEGICGNSRRLAAPLPPPVYVKAGHPRHARQS